MRESKVTVKIPRPLYRKIQQVVDGSGFNSPTDFIVYVLRDLMGEAEEHAPSWTRPSRLTEEEIDRRQAQAQEPGLPLAALPFPTPNRSPDDR